MTRQEFEALRTLPGKEIVGDIVFASPKKGPGSHEFNPTFEAEVQNTLDYSLKVIGRFIPGIPSTTFCFHLGGSRTAICRVDINGTEHRDCGRTHKHEMRNEGEMRNNLPFAIARADYAGLAPGAAWAKVCKEANVKHTGKFVDPSEAES